MANAELSIPREKERGLVDKEEERGKKGRGVLNTSKHT
jgi:hypothetical protein